MEEKARMGCCGFVIWGGLPPETSPWPLSRPTRSSRTRARSSPGPSGPSLASMTATVAPMLLAMSATTCSAISKVRGFQTPILFIDGDIRVLVLVVFNWSRLGTMCMIACVLFHGLQLFL